MLTERFDDALVYASTLHRTQNRKGSDIPYVSHLLSVTGLALEQGATEDQAIAALLHDAVEDQDVSVADIRKRYGDAVATIVEHCTDAESASKVQESSPEEWRARKEAYVASLDQKPASSLLISLCDKIHNAQSIVLDRAVVGEGIWDRFKGKREGSLWYYRSLAAAFERLLPGQAAKRLSALVAEMNRTS